MGLTQIQKIQLNKQVDKILHAPGNQPVRGSQLEMSFIQMGKPFENEAFMNNTVQGENIPETEDKNVENLPVIDELCVYFKIFHARSKCILVFTENGYAVNDKKKVIENLNPFLKYKLLVISKDSMKGGTPIYMELISEQ